jgi:AI-2 transport protein TqsA
MGEDTVREVARPVLPRWLTVVLGLAGTAIAVLGMRAASGVLAPILLALVLTVVVHPVVDRLQARGAPRWLAVLIAVVLVDGVLIALVVGVAISLGQLATLLPSYSQQWNDLLDSLRATLAQAGVGPDQVQQVLHSVQPGAAARAISSLLGGLLSSTATLVFVLATVLFMCVDSATLPARLTRAAGTGRLRPALDGFATSTRSYIVVTTVFGLIVAVLDTVALAILGIPLAILWGLLSFITNYIPNIGFVIGVLPPALLGLLVGGPRSAILVIVLYSAINFVLQSVIQPAFVGDAVGLSVTVTFLSLVVWTWVLGPLGAILSVPLTLLFRAVVLETDPNAGWARALVAHGGSAEEPARRARRRRGPRRRAAAPRPVGSATTDDEGSGAGPAADDRPSPASGPVSTVAPVPRPPSGPAASA